MTSQKTNSALRSLLTFFTLFDARALPTSFLLVPDLALGQQLDCWRRSCRNGIGRC